MKKTARLAIRVRNDGKINWSSHPDTDKWTCIPEEWEMMKGDWDGREDSQGTYYFVEMEYEDDDL